MEPQNPFEQQLPRNIGDAWTMLTANAIIIGLLTAAMAQGPYSSSEQEVWYRYGSLSFLFAGVIMPVAAMFLIRQSRFVVVALNSWLSGSLLGFMLFAGMSGGGV